MQKIDVYEHIIQEFANRSLSERARARVIKNTRDELEWKPVEWEYERQKNQN